MYGNHLNTEHLNTGFIWIPESMGVWFLNGSQWLGGPFEYWTICNRTQIYHVNTRCVQYSDGYSTVFRSPLYMEVQVWQSYLVKFSMQSSLVLHILNKVSTLAFVGSDDADLIRLHSSLDESWVKKNKFQFQGLSIGVRFGWKVTVILVSLPVLIGGTRYHYCFRVY